jgi:hypothetical protein
MCQQNQKRVEAEHGNEEKSGKESGEESGEEGSSEEKGCSKEEKINYVHRT